MWERVRRWLSGAWVCLPFVAVGLIGTGPAAALQPESARSPGPLAYALVVAAALALTARRPPELGLVLNGAIVAAYVTAGYPYGPVLLTVPVAAYLVAERRPVPRAGVIVAADVGVLLVAAFAKRAREGYGFGHVWMLWTALAWTALAWAAIAAAAFAIGAAVRVRRESAAGLRAEQARRVASEERLRMAQDLHDNVGHGLAAIAMQAGVALHVLDRAPEEARLAMRAVRTTSRESLEHLRAELEALRTPGAVRRRPAYGLRELDRLAERVRAGGVSVRVDAGPSLADLPPAVDAAAYRIVQESLTNVLRHADADSVRIRVGREDAALVIDVTDTGRAGAGAVGEEGAGIRGMRAQAESLGGSLHAGPADGGGFAVTARLPVRAEGAG